MKLVIQRVKEASASINGKIIGKINKGFLVLLGISQEDTEEKIDWLVKKLINLRIMADKDGKMNLKLADVGGEILVVSQFTLFADCKKGNRPSFIAAASPEKAEKLYNLFIKKLKEEKAKIKTGEFGAMMQISLINDGPVTIILER
jgi:D-tyrosyl-tRNA(Tyr) deacylase